MTLPVWSGQPVEKVKRELGYECLITVSGLCMAGHAMAKFDSPCQKSIIGTWTKQTLGEYLYENIEFAVRSLIFWWHLTI